MIRGVLAKKIGMTQIFNKDGNVVPVTVLEVGPCYVLGLLDAPHKRVKLGFEAVKESRVKKPQLGYFKKIGVAPVRHIKEFESTDNTNYKVGQEIKVDIFKPGDFVNVSGTSIGKGFQGGMKRWNWMGGPAGHGSMHHRRVGSIGSSADPSRVYKGTHMPGHMGNDRVTIENLRVIKVDAENNLILLKGAVPGKKNACLEINLSRKRKFSELDAPKASQSAVKKNPMKQSKKAVGGKA